MCASPVSLPPKDKKRERWRHFVFTLHLKEFIPAGTDAKDVVPLCVVSGDHLASHFKAEARIKAFQFQLERAPETGAEHFQGYLSTYRSTSFAVVHSFFKTLHEGMKPWVADAKSPAQAWAYTQKEDTRLAGPWTHGKPPSQGARTDLYDFVESAMELRTGTVTVDTLRSEYPPIEARYTRWFDRVVDRYTPDRTDKTHVILCYGPAGTGKSHRCREICRLSFSCEPFPITLRDGVKTSTQANWFDGIDQHESAGLYCIIDEISPYALSLQQFNKLADSGPYSVPVKGGFRKWRCKVLFITSNFRPVDLYPQTQSTDDGKLVTTGFPEPSFYSRIDELYSVQYHPHHEPNPSFSNRVETATNAVWIQDK